MLGMQIIRMNGKHANFEVEQKDLGFVRLGSFQLGGGGATPSAVGAPPLTRSRKDSRTGNVPVSHRFSSGVLLFLTSLPY